jgi:DNA gyrase subunit A
MLIENKETIIVMTQEGYIKQVPQDTFKVQNRGGKGVIGMDTKEADNVAYIKTAMTHDYILFYSNMGRVFQTRVWEIPAGTRTSKGKAVQNVIALRPDEKVTSMLMYDKASIGLNTQVIMSTKQGVVKKTPFDQFANIRASGIIAINLDQDDELLWVNFTDGQHNVILTTHEGKTIIFKESEIRATGRSSRGVRGIAVEKKDYVVGADTFPNDSFKLDLFVIGEKGVGKRSKLSLFKDQHRGGKGVKVASVDDKMGRIAFVEIIDDALTEVIITSSQGQVVKIPLKDIPSRSRSAKGVILMRFNKAGDAVSTATFI